MARPRKGTSERPADKYADEEEPSTVVGLRVPPEVSAKAAGRHPHLIVLAGDGVGRTFSLDQASTIIGRSDAAQVRVRDEGVSRKHARILRGPSEVTLEDLESANGTRVNGEPATRRVLRDGDKIQLGEQTVLKFMHTDALEEGFHQAMYESAVRDALTELYNKRHFVERLASEAAYSRRHRSPLCLLMMDVDHFKRINDGHGHPAGDHVLSTLGQILTRSVRAEDIVARYGGEEFAVLCRATPPMSALQLAERLRASVESHAFTYGQRLIAVTSSIGVALCADSADAAQKLVADADSALYDAKRNGRNRVVLQHHREAK